MIVRRQHTANFTTIGNALFEDERLAADEVGILAFLLSRPHDWEVRRPALMRRWHIGQAALKRIVDNWMRTGWCHARKKRLENGTFEIIYEIRDEPGPSLSEDDIRRALSLVSSEVATDESEVQTAVVNVPDDPEPPPCQPGVVEPVVADCGVVSLLKKDSTKVEREAAREHARKAKGLAAFEARWPTAMADDRAKTAAAWYALPEDQEEPALAGIGPFLEDLKRLGRKHVPAGWRYLEQARWTLLAPAPSAAVVHGGPYVPTSETGKALRALVRIAHTSLPQLGDGRLIYIRPITPQLLALAACDPDSGEVYKIGSKNFGAWREFLREHVTHLGRLDEIQAPWPWPPKADGSIYSGSDPPPLFPGTLATDEDLSEMTKEICGQ